jgi:succinate dehydrogenase / fumarate reductase, cytochrome b subunit
MTSLILTVRESIRYRGRSGQYSWLAHRISGLAILSFLVIHVWDTANAYFWPQAYAWSLAIFKFPLFALGEVGVMAAVLYHAFNGIRITILDFKPEWWRYQRSSSLFTWTLFFIAFIPAALLMLSGLVTHCTELAAVGDSCLRIPPYSEFAEFAR